MIMAMIMGKQHESNASTAEGSPPRRLSSWASVVSSLSCLARRRINNKHHPMSTEANRIVQKLWSYCTVLRDDGLSYWRLPGAAQRAAVPQARP
jgi:hypothetical protein